LWRKRKISIVNGTPRTTEDLEKFLDPMYFMKSTKVQKFVEFDYEIQEEFNKSNNIGGAPRNNQKKLSKKIQI
jgi:hypothetical protein